MLLSALAVAASCQLALAAADPAVEFHAGGGQQVLADIGSNGTLASCPDDLVVRTTLFTYQGAVNEETPAVRQFLGIPFAEPPVGPLRFQPPVTKKPLADGAIVDATKYGSYCYQHDNGEPGFFRSQPGYGLPKGLEESEDCLTLDVWTRRAPCRGGGENANKKAAVLIWVHGGALMTGDSSSPLQRGNRLVANHDEVVVVSVNYRVNVFGFPRAGGLDGRHLNPGFMDVRLAVEWVYHNIAEFGGDPTRMILFGNSAGGTQVDKYAYAWAHDPLVTGYICMSGQGEFSADPTDVSNFTYVAERVGCAGFVTDDKKDYDAEFACMQKADAGAIIGVLNGYNSRENGGSVLNFQPQTDNETSFGNYTDLQVRGMYSKLPQVIGNVANEMVSLYHPWTGEPPDQEVIDLLSGLFVCPAAKAARARQDYGSSVWRYRYFGDFPNMTPYPWMHAYHGGEVPMVFGTTDTYAPNTPEQDQISAYMQKAWVTFARDPVNGLLELGWPHYIEDEDTLVRIGYGNALDIDLVKGDTYDELCSYVMTHIVDVVKRAMPP
ncbi:hypothetical protein SCUCBS95973_009601 [Sporothrix curviconia]|uniref:Carboxylic ester hydrolase n=1 Tax=Sporothrix curviconia TaxID=1260050 RepID=A0ABP0CXY2_9PEZI